MSDLDDQLLKALMESGGSGLNVDDDLPIPLPSMRKKAAAGTNQEQKKRPPKLIPEKYSVNLSDPKGFSIASEELSPPPSATPKPNVITEKTSSPPNSIQQLEASLVQYIDDSIKTIKLQFIDEFKYSLSQTSEEDSIISAFILGIPSEVDAATAEEIKQYHRPSSANINAIDVSMDAHLSLVRKILQIQEKDMQLLALSPDRIVEMDQSISRAIQQVDNQIKLPLEAFRAERGDFVAAQQLQMDRLSQIPNQSRFQLLEAEAALHQVEVATDLLEKKKKRMIEAQNAWKENETNSESVASDNTFIEIKQIAESINSNLKANRIANDSSPTNAMKSSIFREIRSISQSTDQIETDISKLIHKLEKKRIAKVQHYRQPEESDSSNEFINEIKERLRIVRKNHEKMHK